MTEAELQAKVADYLCLQYPDVMFHSDYGSGVKLTPRQAAMQKRQNGGRSKWPDMFVAEPGVWEVSSRGEKLASGPHGLFLELKKEGARLRKKNGDWATEHIAAQAKVLDRLVRRGYCAFFACGFDEAKHLIDNYLGGR